MRTMLKTILVDAVNTFVIKNEGINQEMYELLESYPNPKIIVTNADAEQIEEFGLHTMPYPVFSMAHKPDKTDPAYFETLRSTYYIGSSSLVYFEHNPEAVKSAKSVGITSYWYDPEKKDLVALKEFLDSSLERKVYVDTPFKKFLYNLIEYYALHNLSAKYFLKAYSDYWSLERPEEELLSDDELMFFGYLHDCDIEYTVESPSELDRQDGYINYDDFRERLLWRMEQFSFIVEKKV